MTEANELKAAFGRIAFDVNGILTEITGIQQRLRDAGVEVNGLSTHNRDVKHAGNLLIDGMTDDLRGLNNKLRLVIQILETHAEKI